MDVKNIIPLVLLAALFMGCEQEDPDNTDTFDRKAVLVQFADELIIPSYDEAANQLAKFTSAAGAYKQNPNTAQLDSLRMSWFRAYLAWQEVALWDFGPAKDHGLLAVMNIYPTDTARVMNNIATAYDLNSVANIAAQGFPALEYLLYEQDQLLTDSATWEYFTAVVDRMTLKLNAVNGDWSSYRNTFVDASGTDRGSSLGELFNNTFLPYFEVHVREAKFGIPGGQRTGTPLPGNVEGRYSGFYSRILAQKSVTAVHNAWNGISFVNQVPGPSVIDYVKFTDKRNGTRLAEKLNGQFDDILFSVQALDNDFYTLASTNPQDLNDVWGQCQMAVFTIKSEIASALSITISYVDTDGD